MVKLTREERFPGSCCVQRNVAYAVEVRRFFEIALYKRGNAGGAKLSNKEPQLENDVLSGAFLRGLAYDPSFVVRSHQDYRKTRSF